MKIERYKARDRKTIEYYSSHGWHLRRIWEHGIRQDFAETMRKTVAFINTYNKQNHKKT